MPALLSALTLGLSLLGPPELPPEPAQDPPAETETEAEARSPAPPDPGAEPAPTNAAPVDSPDGEAVAPPPGRSSLPPGLQPVPFPLEQRRGGDLPPTSTPPAPEITPMPAPREASRRSVIDLRDPFDRPPPTPRARHRDFDASRLLMPDLKDPFAPSVRRVRSERLERHVPNDILDPFRSRPRADGPRPPCAPTTQDGTVVQTPGKSKDPSTRPCRATDPDLRDPFTRQRNR